MFNLSRITIFGGSFYNIAGHYFQVDQVAYDRSTSDLMFHDLIAQNPNKDVLLSALGIILLSEQPLTCSQISQMISLSPNEILSILRLVPSLFTAGSLATTNSPVHVSNRSLGNYIFEPGRSGALSTLVSEQ